MPSPSDVPDYYDSTVGCWVYGADNPQEAQDLLATGDYGLDVGTVNGEDYASIVPVSELEGYDEPDFWDDQAAFEDWLFRRDRPSSMEGSSGTEDGGVVM